MQVTDEAEPTQFVSQAFCSALPVAYTDVPSREWEPFATLVLEGAYEATVLAAALNAQSKGSNLVFLTRVGGGAFGNEHARIERRYNGRSGRSEACRWMFGMSSADSSPYAGH